MSELPQGWISAKISDVCLRVVDGSHNPPKSSEVGYPMLSARNVIDHQIVFDDFRLISKSDFEIEHARTEVAAGDVLLTIVGTIGRTAVVPEGQKPFALQRSVAVLKPENVNSRYLAYALNDPTFQQWLLDNAKGTAQKGVYLKVLGSAVIPMAPAHEQTRIVEKLEELISDLDAGVAELKAARKKLGQYRQSLLKAAVEGALTADWRKQHPPMESGEQLLQRILKERRAHWEAKQLAKFAEQGKAPPKGWQDKYPEAVAPDTSDLPALPEGWAWASVDCVLSEIETGKSFKCEERPPEKNEHGVVKVSAVSWGEYDEQESKTCTDPERLNQSLYIREGDFLFSRANTIELVGACVIAKQVHLKVMLSDKILRFVFVEDEMKNWLLHFLRSELGRSQIELLASGNQESMRNIGQERIRQIALPLPPLAEATEILRLLERQLDSANELSESISIGLKQAAAQRKNILRAAFSGQLVHQDPNDEPASVLLERIRAERAAGGTRAGKGRGRKIKTAEAA